MYHIECLRVRYEYPDGLDIFTSPVEGTPVYWWETEKFKVRPSPIEYPFLSQAVQYVSRNAHAEFMRVVDDKGKLAYGPSICAYNQIGDPLVSMMETHKPSYRYFEPCPICESQTHTASQHVAKSAHIG